MSQKIADSESIRRYLLGELSEEELDAVELRMLTDEDYYERVLIADDELMHEFVNNELSAADRARFQRKVLSVPQRHQDLNFIKALGHYANKNASQTVVPVKPPSWTEGVLAFFRRPAVGFASCAALLVTVPFDFWLVRDNQRLRNQLAQVPSQQTTQQQQLQAEQERNRTLAADFKREQDLRAELERKWQQLQDRVLEIVSPGPPSPEQNSRIETFAILLGGIREGGEGNKVSYSPSAKKVRLDIDLEANNYKSYRVALKRNDAAGYAWSGPAERVVVDPGKITLPVIIPTSILIRAEYQLDVRGVASSGKSEPVATYYFRVP
jgi:hypothetical protein